VSDVNSPPMLPEWRAVGTLYGVRNPRCVCGVGQDSLLAQSPHLAEITRVGRHPRPSSLAKPRRNISYHKVCYRFLAPNKAVCTLIGLAVSNSCQVDNFLILGKKAITKQIITLVTGSASVLLVSTLVRIQLYGFHFRDTSDQNSPFYR